MKQQHCRCFFESFGAVKSKTSFILSQWQIEPGRFPIQLLLRSCERYDVSQPTENRNAERTWVTCHDHAWPHSFQVPMEKAAGGDLCSQWWRLGLFPAARCSQWTSLQFWWVKRNYILAPPNHILPGDVMDSFAQVWTWTVWGLWQLKTFLQIWTEDCAKQVAQHTDT